MFNQKIMRNVFLLKWQIVFCIVSFFFATEWVFAQIVTFSEDTTISIAVDSTAVSLVIPAGSTADEVIVNASSVEVTKGSSGTITITSPIRINLANNQNLQTACDPNQSKLIITVATKVIITPTSTTDYCATVLRGSDGGSGGSSGGSTGGSVSVTTTSTTPETETPKEEASMFKDIGSFKASEQKKILQIAELMLEQKTYKVPATKRYRPAILTRGGFAIQIWNAVAGLGCGSDEKFPGIEACKKKAVEEKFISDSFETDKKVTRLQNYDVLLKAKKISLDKTFTGDDLEEVCSDVKKGTKKMARVYFTARQHGIALKYKGNKCKLDFSFSRQEAAKFAVKALAVE